MRASFFVDHLPIEWISAVFSVATCSFTSVVFRVACFRHLSCTPKKGDPKKGNQLKTPLLRARSSIAKHPLPFPLSLEGEG